MKEITADDKAQSADDIAGNPSTNQKPAYFDIDAKSLGPLAMISETILLNPSTHILTCGDTFRIFFNSI